MKRPEYLKKNDKVGLISLASHVDYEDLMAFIDIVTNNWGLEIVEGKNLKNQYFQFAGTDQERLDDFQQMIDNNEIKAIFSARGGYGSSRIIDKVDFRKFKKNPKWIVGFSDITTVHCQLNNVGFQSIHAIVPKQFKNLEYATSIESLKNCLFGEKTTIQIAANPFNMLGKVEGELVGGNLCILAHLIGSKSEINTKGKILFLEDVNEYLYNIDRMIVQLKRAKKFNHIAGLIVGHFTDCKDDLNSPFGKKVTEIILEHTKAFNFPICFNFPVGHEAPNLALKVGGFYTLDVQSDTSVLFEN
jgi:muramoyltetrapeptide carboxypeptidase